MGLPLICEMSTSDIAAERIALLRAKWAQRNGEYDAAPLVLVVPMPPLLTNAGGQRSRHWRSMEREKREYWQTLDTIALFGAKVTGAGWCGFVVPPPPPTPWLRVVLSSAMVLGGRMDTGNAYARHKWLEDWCVRRGYFATDREERKRDGGGCRWAALPTQRVSRQETARITLTITEEP